MKSATLIRKTLLGLIKQFHQKILIFILTNKLISTSIKGVIQTFQILIKIYGWKVLEILLKQTVVFKHFEKYHHCTRTAETGDYH